MKTASDTPATPALHVRAADERGLADFGWLKSRHSFSFGEYYDPRHIGFRTLRVINDDRVAGGGGFPTHPHRDMEIFSYVLEGHLEHKDSMGNARTLAPGEVQLMSAGRGVTHSEYNPDPEQGAHFLQIWIEPAQAGLLPSYTEWQPPADAANRAKVLMISPDGAEGSATIHQDASVYRVRLGGGDEVEHQLAAGRGLWLQVVRGSVTLDGHVLETGDGAATEAAGTHVVRAAADAEALLFDLG
jgi:redox-sensitive bicupin YhaK (pirin superfamily)